MGVIAEYPLISCTFRISTPYSSAPSAKVRYWRPSVAKLIWLLSVSSCSMVLELLEAVVRVAVAKGVAVGAPVSVSVAVGALGRERLNELRRRRLLGPHLPSPLGGLLPAHARRRLSWHRVLELADGLTLHEVRSDRVGMRLRDAWLQEVEGAAPLDLSAARRG